MNILRGMKTSFYSTNIPVVPGMVIGKVGMNLEKDILWISPRWKPWYSWASPVFISNSLLPGTLLTGRLPGQQVWNWQCELRQVVIPYRCCFFTWTQEMFLKIFIGYCENWLCQRLCPVNNLLTRLLASNNGSFITAISWDDLMLVISQANFLWTVFS